MRVDSSSDPGLDLTGLRQSSLTTRRRQRPTLHGRHNTTLPDPHIFPKFLQPPALRTDALAVNTDHDITAAFATHRFAHKKFQAKKNPLGGGFG